MIALALAGLYTCLSLTFALALCKWIPAGRLPALRVARGLEQAAVGGALLCSLLSLVASAQTIAASFQLAPASAFVQLLYGALPGQGWLGMLLCGAVWYGADALLQRPRARHALQLAAAGGLVACAAVTMHAASLSLAAYAAQAVHLYAVSAWLGLLLLAGWCAQAEAPWRAFLAWFSPLAAGCVVLVAISGLLLMNDMSDSYLSALTLNYGQVLLVKHLLVVPLLAFAAINGVLARRRLAQTGFDPRRWIKAESAAALAVFVATAVLSRQAPPHELRQTLRYTPPSAWFLQLYDGVVTPDIRLILTAQPLALVFLLAALLFLGMTFACFVRRLHPSFGLCTALLFAASGYMAVMAAIR